MEKLENLILIGSAGRNNGKTTLAVHLIQKLKKTQPVFGLKIISINEIGESCHRNESGCGMCSNLKGSFELLEEKSLLGEKDTSKMLLAGAEKVFLLKTLRSHIAEAFASFLKEIPENALIICESNSLRKVVTPQKFIFAVSSNEQQLKPSAKEVIHLADQVVTINIPNKTK